MTERELWVAATLLWLWRGSSSSMAMVQADDLVEGYVARYGDDDDHGAEGDRDRYYGVDDDDRAWV